MQKYPPTICPYPKYPCHLKIQFPSPLDFSLFLTRSRQFSPVLARRRQFPSSSSSSSPSPSTIQMAPKRAKVLAKKFTNPKRAKVAHDVPQKQPPTTPTTISTPVKETGVSTKASEAPPSVQPPSVQPVVPPPKPVSSLNFFF